MKSKPGTLSCTLNLNRASDGLVYGTCPSTTVTVALPNRTLSEVETVALNPTAVALLKAKVPTSANRPRPVLLLPEVLVSSELLPNPLLPCPDVLILSEAWPMAVLRFPVSVSCPLVAPTKVFWLLVKSSLSPALMPTKTDPPEFTKDIWPFWVSLILTTLFTRKSKSCASVVPMKLVPETVPALPVSPQRLSFAQETFPKPSVCMIWLAVPLEAGSV